MSVQTEFAYDSVPYPSLTFPQSGPNRLSVMAAYHGIEAADPQKCRVLELGCGNGANLMSFAHVLPESEFVGLDLSRVHIDDANQTAHALNIKNARFLQKDITQFKAEDHGKFDFIIAHGVFSWVPDAVRDSLLTIYGECLSANGIGYISYNTYPGFYFRKLLREIMQYHVRKMSDPEEMVKHSVQILNSLGELAPPESAYKKILLEESAKMPARWTSNIFHDELSEVNQPYYFRQFAEMLGPYGLQYLSECNPEPDTHLDQADVKKLGIDGSDFIEREQYADFVIARRFRSSLVCRSGLRVERTPSADVVRSSHIISRVQTEEFDPDIKGITPVKFTSPKGSTVEINHPLTKAALVHLEKVWARGVRFDDLVTEASALIGVDRTAMPEDEVERTAIYLLKLFENEMVTLTRVDRPYPTAAAERPVSSPFARWQISRGSENVSTQAGMNIELDNDLVKHLVMMLDGSRDRSAMVKEVMQRAEVPETQRADYEKALPELIEMSLTNLAKCGLLVEGPNGSRP